MFSRHGRVFKLIIWLNVNDVKMWLFSCCVVENDVYLQMILSRRVLESPAVMDLRWLYAMSKIQEGHKLKIIKNTGKKEN